MTVALRYQMNQATATQVEEHLRQCDRHFVPALSARVDLGSYASKLVDRAQCFEAWADDALVGLVATYFDDAGIGAAHVSNVSVLPQWAGRGIAGTLLGQCIERSRACGVPVIRLEVSADNAPASRLYAKAGFEPVSPGAAVQILQLRL